MTEAVPETAPHRRAGFTLLEVLGAVAILGISYIMLATASIQGLQAVGQSQRRLDASLLADETLIELELAAETGQRIDPKVDSWESGHFEVELEVLDLSETHQGNVDSDGGEGLLEFLGKEANGPFAPFRERNLLLGYLREVHISVRWFEAADQIEVTRTAFIYDQQGWLENEQTDAQAQQGDANNGEPADDLRNPPQGQSGGVGR